MSNSRSFAIGLTVFALAAGPARSAETPAVQLPDLLTMDDALRIFRAQGLDLLISQAAVTSAEGDAQIADAVPNPNFSVGVLRSFYKNTNPPLFETPWGYEVGLGDSNALEDSISGKRHLRNKVAEAALRAAKSTRMDAERTLGFMVKQQYIQAVLARDQLDFSVEVQKAAGQTFNLIQIRYKSGAINEADEARAETAKLEADQAVRTAQQALEVAKAQLAFLLGVRGQVPDYKVEQDLPKFRVLPALVSATPQSLVDEAFNTRPDLKAITYQRQRAEASVALARRLRFPDLSLNLNYSAEGSPNGLAQPAPNPAITPVSPPTLSISIAGTLPVFYFQQGEIKKASADLRVQELTLDKTTAQINSDIAQGFSNYTANRDLVLRMEGRLLDRAKRALDLVQLQYQKGAASLLEFLDAQRTYIATNSEYLQDLANYWTAVFQLEQAVGSDLR